MRDPLVVAAFSLLPRSATSRWMGWFARTPVSRWIVRVFVAAYGVDLSEMAGTLADYPTLDAFFTRRLRPGARPVTAPEGGLASPVDGAVAFAGRTTEGRFELAPGRMAHVARILGEPVHGERDVAVLYLSPRDYHRVHSPVDGTVTAWRYVPGTLWPVFPAAVRAVEGLFGRNERVVAHIQASPAPVDVVMVGAFGVGRIEAVFTDLMSNTGGAACAGQTAHGVTAGGDLGAFHLGSTVIVVAAPGTWRWEVAAGDVVRVGGPLASLRG